MKTLESINIYLGKGEVFRAKGEYENAEASLLKALRLASGRISEHSRIFMDLGFLYYEWKKFPEAKECLTKAIEFREFSPCFRHNKSFLAELELCLGRIYLNHDKAHAEALPHFQNALMNMEEDHYAYGSVSMLVGA